MLCKACETEYQAADKQSMCPKCGSVNGDDGGVYDVSLADVVHWYDEWEEFTADARKQSERDRDYYDGVQWTDAEENDIKLRGQAPIVKNRIFKKINFLLGMEIRNRTDPKALPRTPMHDDDANAITDGLRYVCDSQDFERIASAEWEQMLIEGSNGATVDVNVVADNVEIAIRPFRWDRLWYDVHSREADYSDAAYKGTISWMTEEEAKAFYGALGYASKDYVGVIEQSTNDATISGTHDDKPTGVWSSRDGGQKRIKVSVCYYKKPGGKGRDRWYTCHYTKSGFLVAPRPTGLVDEHGEDVCPLVMSSGFVTREGMRYGLVRHMIGPQDEINKRSSKALHLLSVRQVASEDGAVLQPDEAREQLAKPDGWIELQRDALKDQRFQVMQTGDMSQGQFALLGEAKSEIDAIGPDLPQISANGGGMSGRAIMMRQQLGSLEIARLEDNHRRWRLEIYRQVWYRIRQFWPEEKWFRVRDDAERTGFRFVGLNRKITKGQRFQELMQKEMPPEQALHAVGVPPMMIQQLAQNVMQRSQMAGQQLPPELMQKIVMQQLMSSPHMQQPMVAGDVAQLDVDIVLDESPDTAILQQEEYESLTSLIPSFLQAKMEPAPLLEMAVEASQLRNKRKLLEMIRKPKQDPKAAQQAAQHAQTMHQLQMAGAQAEVQKTGSEAALNQAKTQQIAQSTQVDAIGKVAEAQRDRSLAMKHEAEAAATKPEVIVAMPRLS